MEGKNFSFSDFFSIFLFGAIVATLIWFYFANSVYNNGWNHAIDAIPKAIIINAPFKVHDIARDIKEGKLPGNEIALDSDGNPAFVCSNPGVSSSYVDGGDFIDITQIFPEKK